MTSRNTHSSTTAAGPTIRAALTRIDRSESAERSRILPDQPTTSPTLGLPGAVFGAASVITLVVEAYERGRTG